MEKYTNKEILDENMLRKSYVNDICMEIIKKINFNINEHKIWISMDDPLLEINLVFIHTNYEYLPDIEKLETQGLTLATSVEIVRKVCDKLSSVSGITGELINNKFKNILDKNKRFVVPQ